MLTEQEELRELHKLIHADITHSVRFNFSGVYGECNQYVYVDARDFRWVLPIIHKYPLRGLFACTAYMLNRPPIKKYVDREYKKAYKEIKDIQPLIYTTPYTQ